MDRYDHIHHSDTEDIAHRINDDLTPDWVLHIEDSLLDLLEYITPAWLESWEDSLE